MAYTNNNGQVRIGVRSGITNSPLQQATTVSASLLQSLYGVWNGDADGSGLTASIYSVWNGSGTNNQTVKNAWNANGNAIDSKDGVNGTIVTPNSTTGYTTSSMTYSTGKLGTASFTFNGSNFVSLPNNTFTFTSDFTVSLWFYVPSNYVSNAYLVSAFDNQSSYPTYYGWMISYDTTNNNVGFYICRNDMGSYYTLGLTTANSTIVKNQWNHITITRKSSTRSRIYINGVLSTSNTSTINPVYSFGLSSIGSSYYAFSYPFWKGANAGLKIDALQTWESELDQAAITELYNSGNGQEYPFTVSNAKITSTVDSVGTNNGIRPTSTLNSNILGPTFTTGKIGNAFSFDGINDFIQLPNNSMNFTGDFSISAWLYYPPETQLVGNTYAFILSNWTAISWDTNLAGWRFITAGNGIYFSTFNGTSTSVLLGAPGQGLERSGWRHVAFTRTGTTYKLWLDGGQYTSTSTTMLAPKYQGTIIPKIGRLGDSTMGGWDSYSSPIIKIDSVSVWNRSLNSDEITQLYNAGNGIQYPFSGYLPSSANQLGVDNGTLMNGCTFGDGKIGKAFQFDGVNDYVALPDNSLNINSNFSVSAWVKYTIGSGIKTILSNNALLTSPTRQYGWGLYLNSNNILFQTYDGTSTIGGLSYAATLTSGSWYHITVTKSGTTKRIYLNGTEVANASVNNITYTATHRPTIGGQRYDATGMEYFSVSPIDGLSVWQKELTQAEVTELYNSGNGKQITTTPIVQTGLVLNLDASRSSSYTGTGSTWTDISGNANNGTLTNGPVFGTSSGGQISFDGVNDYVSIANNSSFEFASTTKDLPFTFTGWVKYGSGGNFINKGDNGNASQESYAIAIDGTGLAITLYDTQGGRSVSIKTSAFTPTQNTWYHYTISYTGGSVDGTGYQTSYNGTTNIYINGVLYTTTITYTTSSGTYNRMRVQNTPLYIGSFGTIGTWSSFFNGSISSNMIYNRVLSQTEITQNFNATKTRFGL